MTCKDHIFYPKAAKFFQWLWDSVTDPTLQTKLESDFERA